MLSFTLVSHLGYMIFGVSMASQAGLAATIFYTAHHITIQATLFLVTGLIERRGGTSSLEGLGGLLKTAPVLALLFFVPAMNLGGIPPLSGFIGKLGLLQAGAEFGGPLVWVTMVGGIATSLLTLIAMAKVWNRAFWGVPPSELKDLDTTVNEVDYEFAEKDTGDQEETDTRPMPPLMLGATTTLVVVSLALTVFAGPLYEYAERAAEYLHGDAYVATVLPEELR